MEKNNNLKEEDLHNLLDTKIKEPGLTLDQLYKDISHIHPKPRLVFYVSLVVWVVAFILMLSLKTTIAWVSIVFLFFVLSGVYVIFLQKKHSVVPEVPWYIMAGMAGLALLLCQPRLKEVGIQDKVFNLARNLFNGRAS